MIARSHSARIENRVQFSKLQKSLENCVFWPSPQHSKNRVRTAGKRVAKTYRENKGFLFWGATISYDEFEIVENWRTSHGAVLNTAQAWLRRLEQEQRPVVAQRLKRFNTIVDKLGTGRSRDLSTMNDIAGVRLIFRSELELRHFREKMDASRAKHLRTHEHDRFDYIKNPKDTGYRGVHDVFERRVKLNKGESPWDGLKFEVQLRTAVQHAWATAVEVYDSVQKLRFKFQSSRTAAYRQFLLISELFARLHEDKNSCLPDLSDIELVNQISDCEEQTGMITMFESLSAAQTHNALRENTILQRTAGGELMVWTYPNFGAAVRAISEIEMRDETVDAVLVSSKTPHHIREAFRNYFDDTSDFLELLEDAKTRVIAADITKRYNEAHSPQ